ncbi:hypothetical protein [Nannocystis bainbridge]|uniref:Uncharacterized protein n=1 Tax=Nannocystis bainbridge TaxID=2995303 RepID=A0ABT5DZ23_9BACT|nr:hypothetical protein [Nannocystis bainbridge]MDC0718874.1 hypothetical protein [Nannocystis bainbridge]
MTVKTSYLSFGSALLLTACFSPTGSDPGTAGPTSGDTTEPPATATEPGTTAVEPTTGEADTDTTTTTTTGVATEPPTGTSTTLEPCTLDICPCQGDVDCEPGLQCHAGQCVECIDSATCGGRVCDPVDHVCRGCREHAECPETACELDDGLCFPDEATSHAYVDPSSACSDQPCSFAQPCCSVAQAHGQFFDTTHLVFHLAPGLYQAGIEVSEGGRRIAVLGGPGVVFTVDADPVIRLGLARPPIDSELYLSQIVIEGGQGSAAVRCSAAADLWLDDSAILGFTGRAVAVSDCDVVLRRSELRLNLEGMLVEDGGTLRLENSLVAHLNMGPALAIGSAAAADLVYTTLGDITQHMFGLFTCLDGTATLVARNSALLSHVLVDTFDCVPSAVDIRDSVVTLGPFANPDKNTHLIQANEVSPIFAGWDAGLLHLAGDGGALAGRARWQPGDPQTDIDGDARPATAGAPDVAGGDRPPDP